MRPLHAPTALSRTPPRPARKRVPQVALNGGLYAVPFHDLSRVHTAAELAALAESVQDLGVQVPVVVYLSLTWGPSVVDGAARCRAGAGTDVPVIDLGELDDALARRKARELNDARRHLTPDDQQAARDARVARVHARKAAGESLRAIAAAEGVSPGQVQRDLGYRAPGASGDALKVGCVTRRPLPDGRPFPASLAAHQFSVKHVTLMEERIEELAQRPFVMLAGRVLSPAEQYDMFELVQKIVLPELYDPEFDPAEAASAAAGEAADDA